MLQDAAFDPEASSTSLLIPCSSEKCVCGRPPCGCSDTQQCTYQRTYGEPTKLPLAKPLPTGTQRSGDSTAACILETVSGQAASANFICPEARKALCGNFVWSATRERLSKHA